MYLDHQKEYHAGTIFVMPVKLTTVEIDFIEGKKFSKASENWLSFSFWPLVLSPEIKHAIFDGRHRSHIIKPYHCLISHDLNFTRPTHTHMFLSVCRCLFTHIRSRKMCLYVLYMFDSYLCIYLCLHKETWSRNLNVRFPTMLGFESHHVWFEKKLLDLIGPVGVWEGRSQCTIRKVPENNITTYEWNYVDGALKFMRATSQNQSRSRICAYCFCSNCSSHQMSGFLVTVLNNT